jgi:hypothetical protein
VVSRPARKIGPVGRAARRLGVEGEKRSVLLALAAFLDEGVCDPSILELSRRARVHRMAVVLKLDKLARDGVIELRRGDHHARQRSTYRFLLEDQPDRKDPPMNPTDSTAPPVPDAHRRHVPRWQRDSWLPAEPQMFEWPELADLRDRHAAIVAALGFARADDNAAAERDALVEVADFVPEAIGTLRDTLPAAEAAFAEARQSLGMATKTKTAADQQARAVAMREVRPKIEADTRSLRRAAAIIEADAFDGERADTAEPTDLIQARHLKAAIEA